MTNFARIGARHRQPLTHEQIETLELMQMVGDGADRAAALWTSLRSIETAMADCTDETTKQLVKAAIEDARAKLEVIRNGPNSAGRNSPPIPSCRTAKRRRFPATA